jgi:two-component system response regulator GlrR
MREILESVNLDIRVQEEFIDFGDSVISDNNLSIIVSRFDSDVVFLLLTEINLKQLNGLLQSFKGELSNKPPIIAVVENFQFDDVVELLKLGITDFLTPPLKAIDIIPRLCHLREQKSQNEKLTQILKEKIGLKQLVGEDTHFLSEVKKISLMAKCNASVLISGETGTGKELCARAVHYLSLRANKPFIPVNCGAIPVELIENELFGHAKGAYTGASQSYHGLIKEADGGTLFLDEIGCLPFVAQVKLLRFFQDKEFRQLGCTKIHQADVRIITASNTDLGKAVLEGKFRQDLFYRLNIVPIILPPLRDRKADIPILAKHFLAKYALEFNKEINDFSSGAIHKLILYHWPGNIRELENVIERAVIFCHQTIMKSADIVLPYSNEIVSQESFKVAKAKTIAQFEKEYIKGLLLANNGNISKAARVAQKNRRALWALIQKHHIDVQMFKTFNLQK